MSDGLATRTAGSRASARPLVRLGATPTLLAYARAVWQRREFALAIPLAELRAQNRNTVLGGLWHLINPLLHVGVYYLIFSVLLGTDRGMDNFLGFLAVGIFVFHYTSKSIKAGAGAIVSNEGLIRAVKFPRALLPVGAVIREFAALGYAAATVLAVVLITGERPSPAWVTAAPSLVLQTLFNVGVALGVARLSHHFRDLRQVLPYALRIWLYLSGVIFSIEQRVTDPFFKAVLELNPAYIFIQGVRLPLLGDGPMPVRFWIAGSVWAGLALVAGVLFFRSREHDYGRA